MIFQNAKTTTVIDDMAKVRPINRKKQLELFWRIFLINVSFGFGFLMDHVLAVTLASYHHYTVEYILE